jgi:hypothetical protein
VFDPDFCKAFLGRWAITEDGENEAWETSQARPIFDHTNYLFFKAENAIYAKNEQVKITPFFFGLQKARI